MGHPRGARVWAGPLDRRGLPAAGCHATRRATQGREVLDGAVHHPLGTGAPARVGTAHLRGEALYLALEDSARRLQARTRTLQRIHGLVDDDIRGFRHALDAPRMDRGLDAVLVDHMDRYPDTRLVVIDVLARVRRPRNPSEGMYDWDYMTTGAFRELAAQYPALAIILVHHANKSGDDGLTAVSGTHGLAAGADNVLTIMRTANGPELHIHGRDIADSEPIPLPRDEAGMWTLESRDSATAAQMSDTRALILDAIRAGAETPKEIAAEADLAQTTVDAQLRRLRKQGEVIQPARGSYALPPDTDPYAPRTYPPHMDSMESMGGDHIAPPVHTVHTVHTGGGVEDGMDGEAF